MAVVVSSQSLMKRGSLIGRWLNPASRFRSSLVTAHRCRLGPLLDTGQTAQFAEDGKERGIVHRVVVRWDTAARSIDRKRLAGRGNRARREAERDRVQCVVDANE